MKAICNIYLLCMILSFQVITGCKKYLEKKTDKKLVVPSTVADLQALLDNVNFVNVYAWGLGESSSDNYYLAEKDWTSLYAESDREAYIWGEEVVGNYPNNWSSIYRTIYTTNVVLDNIDKVSFDKGHAVDRNNVEGQALFIRAFDFFRLAATFANSFDNKTADKELGIPLRLSSDFNKKSFRSTLRQTYEQITSDLVKSLTLLPLYPEHVLRASKGAAYGLLARVYLAMRDYDKAELYADSCLQVNDKLMNFNELNPKLNYPISIFNKETLFYVAGGAAPLINSKCKIDSALYVSYADNDLRKIIFFKQNADGSHGFYGNYSGSSGLFEGIASDEQYLIKAECLARTNKVQDAMNVLNKLLTFRWKSGTFAPIKANDSQEALSIILRERRKELLMRDLRWQDIKRLNKEGANISLKRVLGDKTYELRANSSKFALPLPDYVIKVTGMQQNPR